MIRLLFCVLLSGAASLVYQVVWTKKLISVTSATVTAQAVVLSIFMAGLGLGAYLAGRKAKKIPRPLLGYAAVEIAALLLAFLSIPLIDASDGIRTALSGLGVPLSGGLWIQLLALSAFLLIPTAFLGASLPFLLEHVERGGVVTTADRGRTTGLLYGVNTFGAAAGAVLAGFWLVEYLGLFGSLCLGMCFALVAALVASLSSRSAAPEPGERESTLAAEPALVLIAALGGFVGLGAEVVWTRLVALVIPNTTYAFTQVLAAVLIGIGVGGYLAAIVVRSVRGEDRSTAQLRVLRFSAHLSLLAAVLFALVPLMFLQLAEASAIRISIGQGASWSSFLLALLLIPPSALIGALLPLLVAASRLRHGSQAFGELYAANTIGSVLGSAAVGFLLLPILGAWGSSAALVLATLVLALLLFGAAGKGTAHVKLLGAAATAGLLLFSVDIPVDIYRSIVGKDVKILEFKEGAVSDVMVTEDKAGSRRLWINSSWVARTSQTRRSGFGPPHRILGHLPALLVDHPKRAVGIALGTGQTFAASAKHGFAEFHCVEINPAVIELSTRWFKEANDGILESPLVTIHNDDGRAFLRAAEQRFDLIVLEPLQAWSAGTTNLYTRDFYEEARSVLAPGGVVAQWMPFYGQGPDEMRSMLAAGLDVFPNSTLWLDKFDGILIMRSEPAQLSLRVFEQRIRERNLTQALEANALSDPADLMSLFLMGPRGLARWVKGAKSLTDDHPFLEFVAARQTGRNYFPDIMESSRPFLESPADYATETSSEDQALFARAKLVRDAVFEVGRTADNSFESRAQLLEEALAKEPGSLFLRVKYRDFILEWAGNHRTRQKGAKAIEVVLQRGIRVDPDQGEAMLNLAQLYRRTGRVPEAIALLERAVRIQRVRSIAQQRLTALTGRP